MSIRNAFRRSIVKLNLAFTFKKVKITQTSRKKWMKPRREWKVMW